LFYQANHYARQSLQCLTIVARAKVASGDYDGALVSFRSLLESAEKEQDRPQMALAHEGIGENLFRQDRYPEALEQYRKALELATDAEHVGYASLQCGDTLWRLGHYTEAAAMFANADASAQRFPPLRLNLMYGRAGMLLSQNRFQEAAHLARAALAADAAQTPDLDAKLQQVIGLALMGEGNKAEAVKKCEVALAAAEAGHDISDILDAEAAALQARIEQGDRKSALRVFQQIEPRLASRPELLWRALALASRADARYAVRAREALLQLSRQWGDSAYNKYLTRPDIEKISRPVLQTFSEIH
jgi:tetratricopeptide (TPR) repeat protein